MSYNLDPIAIVHSPFKEKFGVPRQPGLVTAATATIELLAPYDRDEVLQGLEGFSHVWLVFVFHQTAAQGWQPTVRPPRLGGNTRVGVFASRSTFRPNPLGLSVVELLGFGREDGKLCIQVRGADLVDGTPVLDIKPYIPYADAIAGARGGYANDAPAARLAVAFSPAAESTLATRAAEVRELITQVLAVDPRPAYREGEDAARVYGMRLLDFDLRWQIVADTATVIELAPAD